MTFSRSSARTGRRWSRCHGGSASSYRASANAQRRGTLFQEAAAQGQSIVVATGDNGSEDCNEASGVRTPSWRWTTPGASRSSPASAARR